MSDISYRYRIACIQISPGFQANIRERNPDLALECAIEAANTLRDLAQHAPFCASELGNSCPPDCAPGQGCARQVSRHDLFRTWLKALKTALPGQWEEALLMCDWKGDIIADTRPDRPPTLCGYVYKRDVLAGGFSFWEDGSVCGDTLPPLPHLEMNWIGEDS